jgi:RHS repeat-associated protein
VERHGQTRHRLVHGGGIDDVYAEVVMAASGPEVRHLYQDAGANVSQVAITDPAGTTTVEAAPRRYEGFGSAYDGASVVERGFAGRPVEGPTGLVYLRARHYDPETGSFLQRDPLGIDAHHLYAYAANNPYVFWDPFGLDHTPRGGGGGSGGSPTLGGALANVGLGVGLAVAGFIPYVGDLLDIYDIARPGASTLERGIGAGSLGLNAITAGLAPNAGPILRGASQAGQGVSELFGVGRRALGLEDLARFRAELGLNPGQGALARLDVGDRTFYGINAHGQPVSLRTNPVTRTHAEADAFQQAANAGVSGGRGTLFVDRDLCGYCGRSGGVAGLARQLGLDELEIVTPAASRVVGR